MDITTKYAPVNKSLLARARRVALAIARPRLLALGSHRLTTIHMLAINVINSFKHAHLPDVDGDRPRVSTLLTRAAVRAISQHTNNTHMRDASASSQLTDAIQCRTRNTAERHK